MVEYRGYRIYWEFDHYVVRTIFGMFVCSADNQKEAMQEIDAIYEEGLVKPSGLG